MSTADGRGLRFGTTHTDANTFTVTPKDRLGRKCPVPVIPSGAGGAAAANGSASAGGGGGGDMLTAELVLLNTSAAAAGTMHATDKSTLNGLGAADEKSVAGGLTATNAGASSFGGVSAIGSIVPVSVKLINGVYHCSYNPVVTGVYSLSVLLSGAPISGSPFKVMIGPTGWLFGFGGPVPAGVGVGTMTANGANLSPNRFTNPTGVAVDARAELIYVADSANHRIQVFNRSDGAFVRKFGSYGTGDGQFNGPYCIAIAHAGGSGGSDGQSVGGAGGVGGNDQTLLYVTDQNNHRVQVFRAYDGSYLRQWGKPGSANGQFLGPAGISLDSKQELVYVTEFSGNRIQVFVASTGAFVRKWGSVGSGDGEFSIPYAIAIDNRHDTCFVTDCNNNRIQMFRCSDGKFLGKYIGSTTVAGGSAINPNSEDNTKLSCPWILAYDPHPSIDMLYVTDCRNNRVMCFRYQPHNHQLIFVKKVCLSLSLPLSLPHPFVS